MNQPPVPEPISSIESVLPVVSTVSAMGIGICIAVVTLVFLYSKPRSGRRRLVAALAVGAGFVVPLLLDPDVQSEPAIGATLTVLAVVIGVGCVAAVGSATEARSDSSRSRHGDSNR